MDPKVNHFQLQFLFQKESKRHFQVLCQFQVHFELLSPRKNMPGNPKLMESHGKSTIWGWFVSAYEVLDEIWPNTVVFVAMEVFIGQSNQSITCLALKKKR